jgi:hypothetical protein
MSAHDQIIVYCVLAFDDVAGLLQLVLVLLQAPLHLLDALLAVRVLRIGKRKLQLVYHLLLLGYEGRLGVISRMGLRDLLREAIKLVRHRLMVRGISFTLGVK